MMMLHCFLYACILLLLSGDMETNPGPVTTVCPECSRLVHIRKNACDYGSVFISKKFVSVCPKYFTSVHIKMAACNTCGYVLSHDPIRKSE